MIEAAKGGVAVLEGDDDHPAYKLGLMTDKSDTPTALDTAQCYGDVYLVRYEEEVIAARHAADAEKSERQVREADSQYLHGASSAEISSGNGERTRFAQRRHVLQLQDETGAVRKSWSPESGILEN